MAKMPDAVIHLKTCCGCDETEMPALDIIATAKYGFQQMGSIEPPRIHDVLDPTWLPPMSLNWKIKDGHCFHLRFEPAGFRYVTVFGDSILDKPEQHYQQCDARFIDTCCRPDCGQEIIR